MYFQDKCKPNILKKQIKFEKLLIRNIFSMTK